MPEFAVADSVIGTWALNTNVITAGVNVAVTQFDIGAGNA